MAAPAGALVLANAAAAAIEAAPAPPQPIAGANAFISVVPVKKIHRERPETETEPCTWYIQQEEEGENKTLAPVQQVFLRSVTSKEQSTIWFVNESDRPARAIWVDFQGREVAYSVIKPGEKKRYRTYISHPWIMRDADTNTRLMLNDQQVVYALEEEMTVKISAAPKLHWTQVTHKHFPQQHKAVCRTLLLSHKRLRHGLECSAPQSSSPQVVEEPTLHDSTNTVYQTPVFVRMFRKLLLRPDNTRSSTVAAPAGPMAMDVDCSTVEQKSLPLPDFERLGDLPLELIHHIVHFMAPQDQLQDISKHPDGHPDIQPALLPSDPATWGPVPPPQNAAAV